MQDAHTAKDYSPFTPGIPVPLDFFVGREAEVRLLVEKAGAAASGRFERTFVLGDRGIGKSSLCSYAARAAELEHNILPVHVFLGGVTGLEEMARRVFERLVKDSVGKPWHEKVKGFLGDHVKQVGLFGITVEFDATLDQLSRLVNDFAPALRNLLKTLGDTRTGLMLILDDLNGLAGSSRFAEWLKSLVDEVATGRDPLPLSLVLVGLPERRNQLVQSQPSLARVFDLVEIKPLSEQEAETFFRQSFASVGMAILQEAVQPLWRFSGGYPPFAHEIGDATFKADTDRVVTRRDAFSGISNAVDIIGGKYIQPQIYEAIRSQHYRSILSKLALGDVVIRRKEYIHRLSSDETKVFDNFLRKMRELGVLRQVRDLGPGVYMFSSLLYSTYFWLEAQRGVSDIPEVL